jgi:hypothetical protein
MEGFFGPYSSPPSVGGECGGTGATLLIRFGFLFKAHDDGAAVTRYLTLTLMDPINMCDRCVESRITSLLLVAVEMAKARTRNVIHPTA